MEPNNQYQLPSYNNNTKNGRMGFLSKHLAKIVSKDEVERHQFSNLDLENMSYALEIARNKLWVTWEAGSSFLTYFQELCMLRDELVISGEMHLMKVAELADCLSDPHHRYWEVVKIRFDNDVEVCLSHTAFQRFLDEAGDLLNSNANSLRCIIYVQINDLDELCRSLITRDKEEGSSQLQILFKSFIGGLRDCQISIHRQGKSHIVLAERTAVFDNYVKKLFCLQEYGFIPIIDELIHKGEQKEEQKRLVHLQETVLYHWKGLNKEPVTAITTDPEKTAEIIFSMILEHVDCSNSLWLDIWSNTLNLSHMQNYFERDCNLAHLGLSLPLAHNYLVEFLRSFKESLCRNKNFKCGKRLSLGSSLLEAPFYFVDPLLHYLTLRPFPDHIHGGCPIPFSYTFCLLQIKELAVSVGIDFEKLSSSMSDSEILPNGPLDSQLSRAEQDFRLSRFIELPQINSPRSEIQQSKDTEKRVIKVKIPSSVALYLRDEHGDCDRNEHIFTCMQAILAILILRNNGEFYIILEEEEKEEREMGGKNFWGQTYAGVNGGYNWFMQSPFVTYFINRLMNSPLRIQTWFPDNLISFLKSNRLVSNIASLLTTMQQGSKVIISDGKRGLPWQSQVGTFGMNLWPNFSHLSFDS